MFLTGLPMAKNQISPLDLRMLEVARSLAEKARGRVSPNPPVGAVIYNGAGKILGRGWTQPPGGDHAEIQALKKAGARARGARLAVTLEPCCFYGRTPPCTAAIIRAGIKHVAVAKKDLNPRVNGKGLQILRRAGLAVIHHPEFPGLDELYEAFFHWIRTKRPLVALKLATGLNGGFTVPAGRWITGPESRALVHRIRSRYDGIAVGIKTVLADDPLLNVRHVPGPNPVRFIFDTHARIPAESNLNRTARNIPTYIVCRPGAKLRGPSFCYTLPQPLDKDKKPDLRAFLREAGNRGITSLLVEGGPELAAAFLRARLIDKIYWFIAPRILPAGPSGGEPLPALSGLRNPVWRQVGTDALLTAHL
jgi:diaminohydroxyphosphoribosylaminopyrimidine deaminase/5-amino-6-(5-phosphoribosylamino)uracil reductase